MFRGSPDRVVENPQAKVSIPLGTGSNAADGLDSGHTGRLLAGAMAERTQPEWVPVQWRPRKWQDGTCQRPPPYRTVAESSNPVQPSSFGGEK